MNKLTQELTILQHKSAKMKPKNCYTDCTRGNSKQN